MTPKKLLDQLSGYYPPNQDEMGGCVFCGGTPPGEVYGDAERFLTDHEKGCVWVKARRLLRDKIPASREVNKDQP